MKKFFTAILTAAVTVMTFSCEKPSTTDPNAPIINTPEGEEITVLAEGGNYSFVYEIANPVEGGSLSAVPETATEWISNIDLSTADVVKFDVSRNTSTEARTAIIVLTYTYDAGEVTKKVSIKQNGSQGGGTEVKELTVFDGSYYGNKFSKTAGNYWINISDNGYTADGKAKANSEYYRFDVFGDFPEDKENIVLKEGTYTLDLTAIPTHKAGTFTWNQSQYIYTDDEAAAWGIQYTSGVLTVTREGNDYVFEFIGEDANGTSHHMIYRGPQSFIDRSGSTRPDGSTITDDYTAHFSGNGVATNHGDNGAGVYQWDFKASPVTGDGIMLTIWTDSSESSFPTGTFTASDDHSAGTFSKGSLSGTNVSGSALLIYELENLITGIGLFDSGSVTISNDGGQYTIDVNTVSENGHNITGKWTGSVTVK